MSITAYGLELSVELDTATFPSHAIVDITSTVISVDIDFGVDADNGACTVKLTEMPADADINVRLYVYAGFSGTALIFNGFILEYATNADGTVTLSCVDAMYRLRYGWSLDDRTYTSATEQSVVQNLVEASGIDASLTSIAGASWLIGVAQDVILHGGTPDVLTGDPGNSDVPMDLIRRIDEATPLYVTYSAGDGAVYRRAWTLGSSVATFATGSGGNAWDVESRANLNETFNACKVTGLQIAGIPLDSLYQQTTFYVPDPPKYFTRTINNSLIEDQTQADAVTLAYVNYERTYFVFYSWSTALNNTIFPADTATIQGDDTIIKHIHHTITGETAITQFSGKT